MDYIITGVVALLVVFVANMLSKRIIKKQEDRLSNLDNEKRLIAVEQKLHSDKNIVKIYYTVLYIIIVMWVLSKLVV